MAQFKISVSFFIQHIGFKVSIKTVVIVNIVDVEENFSFPYDNGITLLWPYYCQVALIQSENHAANKEKTAGRYQFDTHLTGIGLRVSVIKKISL